MKTTTQQEILTFIKQKGETTAKAIIEYVGFHPTGVFRHLRKLSEKGLIAKKGKMPRIVYYALSPGEKLKNDQLTVINNAWRWVKNNQGEGLTDEIYCPTRDVFQARLEQLLVDMKQHLSQKNLPFLINAIVGEIGNNSFDHNLGNWPDKIGIYLAIDLVARRVVLADRGQGVLATIKKVRPTIKDDRKALQVAFTEVISGRAPEQRGNGLKFVRQVVQDNRLELKFYSGQSLCYIDTSKFKITASKEAVVPGTLAIIKF